VLNNTVTTIDASDATGDISLAIDGTILLAAAEIEIDLGAGENTLRLEGIATDVEIGTLVFTDDDLSVTGVSILSLVDAITLAAGATLDLDGIAQSALGFEGAVDLVTFTLALDNTAASLDLTFERDLDGGTLDLGDAVETVTMSVEGVLGQGGAVTFAGEALETLTLNTEAAATFDIDATDALATLAVNAEDDVTTVITGQNDADEDTLTTITLIDASDDGDVDFDVVLTNTTNLVTINATVGEAGEVDIDASGAAFDGAVTINVEFLVNDDGDADGDFIYDATGNTDRETFVFTGDNLGDVEITGFVIGVAGNVDRLDLSEFGITDVDDLNIDAIGPNTDITAANDEFDGTITLVNVDLTAATIDVLNATFTF
jgi:hypothetical protein